MAIRFSLPQFLETAGAVAAGTLSGKMAGQQIRDERELADFSQALNLAQLVNQQQQAQDKALMGMDLEPGSQALVAQGMANRTSPFASLAQHPLLARRPGMQQVVSGLGQPQAPGVTLAGQPGAVGPRTFQSPYGPLTIKGVNEKEAAAAVADFGKIQKEFTEIDLRADPNTFARVQALIGQWPAKIDTPEKLAQARQITSELTAIKLGAGPRLRSQKDDELKRDEEAFTKAREASAEFNDEVWEGQLPGMLAAEESIAERRKGRGNPYVYYSPHREDIARLQQLRQQPGKEEEAGALARELRGRLRANKSPKEEGEAVRRIHQTLGDMDPVRITPEIVRGLYDRAKIGYLVEGLPDAALNLGGAAVRKAYDGAIGRLAGWVNIDPRGQQLLLSEIAGYAKVLGIDPDIPESIQRQMSEADRLRVQKLKQDITYAKSAEGRAQNEERRRQQRHEAEMQEAKRKREAELGKLNEDEEKALQGAKEKLNRARNDLTNGMRNWTVFPADIDFRDEKSWSDDDRAYIRAQKAIWRAEDELHAVHQRLKIQAPAPDTSTRWPTKKKEAPKVEPPPPPGGMEKVRKAVTGAVDTLRTAVTGVQAPPAPGARAVPQRSKGAPARRTAERMDRMAEQGRPRTGAAQAAPPKLDNAQRNALIQKLMQRGMSREAATRAAAQYR